MSLSTSVEEFVAIQPRLAWRRSLLRSFIRLLGFKVLWRVDVAGLENIPASGPTLLMMNHISAIDPVIFMGAVTHRFVIPVAKAEVMDSPIYRPLVRWWGSFYVNRGEVDRKALTNSIELVKSGQLLLLAPEGTRHPEGLSRPKDGLAYIATKADAVVVPAAIAGAVGWGERLRRFRRSHLQVVLGRPFKFKTDGRGRIPREELSAMMEEAMYQLALAIPDESLRGQYRDVGKATTQYLEFLKA